MVRAALAMLLLVGPALARDNGQWDAISPATREWFQGLKQPDHPGVSCCGEADAVEADEWRVMRDHVEATVTNGRGYVPDGTVISVPLSKMKQDAGNPTGHSILFLSSGHQVFCFVVGAGI
jgi:hypothetical protein